MPHAILRDNRIVIQQFRRQQATAYRGIGGLQLKGHELIMPLDWGLAELSLARLPNLTVSKGLQAWIDRQRCIQTYDNGTEFKTFDGMHDYQGIGAKWLLHRGRTILADKPGLGKTVQAVSATEHVYKLERRHIKTLVVCKNPFTANWAAEIKSWSGRQSTIAKAAGRVETLNTWLQRSSGYFIVGWGTLRVFPELANVDWDVIIADESHKIKNRKTKTFKALKKIKSKFLFLLSATPYSLHNAEVWTSLNLIDPKKFRSYWRFYDTFVHTIMVGDFPKIVGDRNTDVFAALVSNYMMQRTPEQCMDELPPVRREKILVDMHPKQATAYIGMANTMIAELAGKPLAAPTPLSRLTRLRQIASTTMTLWEEDYSGKLDAVVEFVKEVDCQVVVATRYRQTVKALGRRLRGEKISAAPLVGGMGSERVQDAFHANKFQVLVMTRDAGGESLNLDNADLMIVLERPWNPATEEQLEGRVLRPASGKKRMTRIVYFMHKGIDEQVEKRVWHRRKLTVASLIEILKAQKEAGL